AANFGEDSGAIRKLAVLGKISSKTRGEKTYLSQYEVIPFLGMILSHQIARQLEKFYPTDGHTAGRFGKINRIKTYQAAVVREGKIPPQIFAKDDIRVYPKEENTLILLVADFSTSMREKLEGENLSKLEFVEIRWCFTLCSRIILLFSATEPLSSPTQI
ncbi:MAG: hypothetical protein ACXACI_11480, partial [Candidatus Hodarchaeales archaeon]